MTICEVRTSGKITIILIPLQVDHVVAMTMEEEILEIAARKPASLLLDFSRTKYISSTGLRALLKIAKAQKAGGGRFGVFAITPFVDHIFSMSGFSRLFSIYTTEEEAIKAVSQ